MRNSLQNIVFAESSQTDIPDYPVAGKTYRKINLENDDIRRGWPYNIICDSAVFNEIMYRLTSLMSELETQGVLSWCDKIDYRVGSLCIDSAGMLKRCILENGPSTEIHNPVEDIGGIYWEEFKSGNEPSMAGWEIGTMFAHLSARAPDGAYLLDGQTIKNCREAYPGFWSWLQRECGEIKTIEYIYGEDFRPSLTENGIPGETDYAVELVTKDKNITVGGGACWWSFDLDTEIQTIVYNAARPEERPNGWSATIRFHSRKPIRVNSIRMDEINNNFPPERIVVKVNSQEVEKERDSSTWWFHFDESYTHEVDMTFYSTESQIQIPEVMSWCQELTAIRTESTGWARVIDNYSYELELKQYGFCGAFVVTEEDVRLPDYRGAFPMGGDKRDRGMTIMPGLPNITGSFIQETTGTSAEGAFYIGSAIPARSSSPGGDTDHFINFDASRSSEVYGNSDTVQPPAIKVSYCIQVYNATTAIKESAEICRESAEKMSTYFDGELKKLTHKLVGDTVEQVDELLNEWGGDNE